jgi:hypothetical protein
MRGREYDMNSRHRLTAILAGVLVFVVGMLTGSAVVQADVCLMTYPTSTCEYRYSSLDNYTVGVGHPLYDPLYDLNGEVLVKIDPVDGDAIALDVYQAPGLIQFVLDEVDQGYFSHIQDHEVVVDGYNNSPTVYSNILLVIDTFDPVDCVPTITVDGNPALYDPALGYYYPIGDLVVSTPVGNKYSDTVTHSIVVGSCLGARIWAFSDEDFSLTHDLPGECFTAYSHDTTVPVESRTTWGALKSHYR